MRTHSDTKIPLEGDNVCYTNNAQRTPIAERLVAEYLNISKRQLTSAPKLAKVLIAVERFELFTPQRRRELREKLQLAFALYLLLLERSDDFVAEIASNLVCNEGEDRAKVAVRAFIDCDNGTPLEKRYGESALVRNSGVLRYLADLGVDPRRVAEFLRTRGNGVDACYRKYVQAQAATRPPKAKNGKVSKRVSRARVLLEKSTSAREETDLSPPVKGGDSELTGSSDSHPLAMADGEDEHEILDSAPSFAGQSSTNPRSEDSGFALEHLQGQAAQGDFIFLGLRVDRAQPKLRLRLIEKINIGPHEAGARKILRAVKAFKEGARDWSGASTPNQ